MSAISPCFKLGHRRAIEERKQFVPQGLPAFPREFLSNREAEVQTEIAGRMLPERFARQALEPVAIDRPGRLALGNGESEPR